MMNPPLPAPPKRRDLVESFDALLLAGKKDNDSDEKLLDPPVTPPDSDHENSFIGGFRPELLALKAALDIHRRLSHVAPAVNPTAAAPMQPPKTSPRPSATSMPVPQPAKQSSTTPAQPPKTSPRPSATSMPVPQPAKQSSTTPAQPPRTPPRPPVTSMPIPQPPKQSLTMQHALKPMSPHTPARPAPAPSSVTPPSRPHPDSLPLPPAMAQPSISASGRPSHAAPNVTPTRPRASSISPSTTSSPGSNTAQCSAETKAGRQCKRRVKIPRVHSLLSPDIPALYCHQHRQAMITAQTGFYVPRPGHEDKFIEYSRMRTLENHTELFV
jgi:hypothetical protein